MMRLTTDMRVYNTGSGENVTDLEAEVYFLATQF